MRYAEEQQDAALLSVSSFQKALKDPNQMIRAGALRILCGIRVPIIAPVMMLAIKESSSDMSPYVRKVAAHAIPKLYSLDPDMQESLVEIVEKLLKDKTTVSGGLGRDDSRVRSVCWCWHFSVGGFHSSTMPCVVSFGIGHVCFVVV